jgi:hypothetical protein
MRALSHARLKEENIALRKHLEEKYDFGKLTAYSDSMKQVLEKVKDHR